jgi:hypothetical protein
MKQEFHLSMMMHRKMYRLPWLSHEHRLQEMVFVATITKKNSQN